MNPDQIMRKILFLPDAATKFADSIDHLHFFVITITMFGSALVFLSALYFIIRYYRKGAPSATPGVNASRKLEAVVISSLLGLFVLWWVIGFTQYISYATPPRDAQPVYVIAKQWMWKFAYADGRATIGALVVPVDRDIRLVMTSRDVIHSFYVPAFRIKRDVLPGRYTSAWFRARQKGVFDVFCAEYCGKAHSRMWAKVIVLSRGDYEQWLSGGAPPVLENAGALATLQGLNREPDAERSLTMAEEGRRAASRNGCFACHTIDGQPHIGPSWRNLYGQLVELQDGRKTIADEEYLTRSMMDPIVDVVRGFRPVMPTYLGTLSQPDAGAIVEFIRSLATEAAEPRVLLPKTQVFVADAGVPTGAATPQAEKRALSAYAGAPLGSVLGIRQLPHSEDASGSNQQPKTDAPPRAVHEREGSGAR